jgi:hypothetical protein
MEVRWSPKTRSHIHKHSLESPEISPEFVERFLAEAHPAKHYADTPSPWRQVFDGYSPPETGRPYRVIFEVDEDGAIWPVTAFWISDREFTKER